MGLFSSFRKNKQESAAPQGQFLSRSAGDSSAARGRTANSRKPSKNGKDDASDPLLPEKKRARRRLIGALALVLAMVIVLPMILDSEPRPLADDIAIQIPSKDGGKEQAKGTRAEENQPKEEFIDPATLAQDKSASNTPSSPSPAVVSAPVPASVPSNTATSAALTAPAQTSSTAQAPAAPKETEVPATQAKNEASAAKEAAKPLAKTEPKETKTASASKPAKPAERKEEPKKEAAKPKVTEKNDNTDDADRAMAILEGKSTAPEKKAAPTASNGKFVIQVAALATQEKIDELRNKLSSAGIKSFTQKVATQSGDRTRIRVGPFSSRDEADKMRAKINKLGLNATIVPA